MLRLAALILVLSLGALAQAPCAPAAQAQQQSGRVLRVQVFDENGVAVPGAIVTITTGTGETKRAQTNAAGRATFSGIAPARNLKIAAAKQNFYNTTADVPQAPDTPVEITLAHVQELKETVNVSASPATIDPAQTATETTLGTAEVVNIPYPTSRDVRNVLRYFPQVVQDAPGAAHVAGGEAYQNKDVLDSFDITSPVSGNLAMRFSADAVRSVDVESSRISSQYGRFSGGVIAFATGMGDDQYRFDATNFIPSWANKKGITFDKWVPRATVSGPIMKGKIWFLDSADAEYDSNIFTDLPKGSDRDPFIRGSNLLKGQINFRPSDIFTAEFVQNVANEAYQGLSLLNPQPATIRRDTSSYLVGVKEMHYFSGGSLLELGFAGNAFRDSSRPQGTATYVVTPNGNSGNYFQGILGHSRRAQGIANLYLRSFQAHGQHQVQTGVDVDQVAWDRTYHDHPIDIVNPAGTLVRESLLPRRTQFFRDNLETGAYVQDRWSPTPRLLIEPGLRFDWDEIVRRPLASPRVAATYAVGPGTDTKLSAGIGVYYDRTHLDYLGRALLGPREDTYFTPAGTVAGPPLTSRFVANPSAMREPRWLNWSVGIEQKLPGSVYGSVEFIRKRETDGWTFVNTNPVSVLSGVYALSNSRADRYHSIQFTARKQFRGNYSVYAAYVRSYAHSNAVMDFSPDYPVFGPQAGGPLPWDAPNRVVSWGWFPLPWTSRLDFVYGLTWRTGFAWTAVNTNQQVVGSPDAHRFPDFVEFNPGLELRFGFHGYALALRGVLENATASTNPVFVNNNVDSPQFGTFSVRQGRAVTARIRFLGKK
jgi:hypothetical protein